MFPWIDLIEIIKKIVDKIRTGRLLGKSSGFNTSGDVVDQESYETEATKIIKRGVLCFKFLVLQTWTISTVTAQPTGVVKVGPFPQLIKESIIREEQVECPSGSLEASFDGAATCLMLFSHSGLRDTFTG